MLLHGAGGSGAGAIRRPAAGAASFVLLAVSAPRSPSVTRSKAFGSPGEPVFAASVRVCAPLVRVDSPQPPAVARWTGVDVVTADPVDAAAVADRTWAGLARGLGTSAPPPVVAIDSGKTMGDWSRATAGFRDEYYGLVPGVGEHRPGAQPLVTAGLVDPGRCRWGERPARFAGRVWDAPAVDVGCLEPRIARWVEARLRPKVVVATQTRVIEAAVDEKGEWVPSVPLLAVDCDVEDLWHVAAALLAPPLTAWALERWRGTALADDAIKLAAAEIAELPAPRPGDAWDEGAAIAREVAGARDANEWSDALARLGATMAVVYGLAWDDPVVGWWASRLPHAGGTRRTRPGRLRTMERADAERMAAEWVDVWNRHDVEAVLAHFTDDVVVASPLAGVARPRGWQGPRQGRRAPRTTQPVSRPGPRSTSRSSRCSWARTPSRSSTTTSAACRWRRPSCCPTASASA